MPALRRDVLLDIELSAICSRHRYTDDPAAVIAELRERAADRTDILAHVAQTWADFYRDKHTAVLCDALEQLRAPGGIFG